MKQIARLPALLPKRLGRVTVSSRLQLCFSVQVRWNDFWLRQHNHKQRYD